MKCEYCDTPMRRSSGGKWICPGCGFVESCCNYDIALLALLSAVVFVRLYPCPRLKRGRKGRFRVSNRHSVITTQCYLNLMVLLPGLYATACQ